MLIILVYIINRDNRDTIIIVYILFARIIEFRGDRYLTATRYKHRYKYVYMYNLWARALSIHS